MYNVCTFLISHQQTVGNQPYRQIPVHNNKPIFDMVHLKLCHDVLQFNKYVIFQSDSLV